MADLNQHVTQDLNNDRNGHQRSLVGLGKVVVIWWLVTLAVIAAVLLYSSGQLYLPLVADAVAYLVLWILISITCLYFVKKWSFSVVLGKGIDLLEIPVYLTFTGLILIGLFGIAPYFDRYYLIPGIDISTDVFSGLLLTGVGLLAMWLGYALTVLGLKKRAIKGRVIKKYGLNFARPSFYRTFGLYIFLLIIRFLLFRAYNSTPINLGFLQQPVTYLLEVVWFLVSLFTMQMALRRWPKWVFIVVIVIEAVFAVLSGWSSTLLKIVFLLIASFAYAGKPLPYKFVLAGLFAGFILTPVTRSMRYADLSSSNSIIESLTTSSERYWGGNTEGVSTNQELLIRRQSGTAQLPGLILKLTPSLIPYRSSAELLSIPVSFIPRAFWPDKFESGSKGTVFVEEYLGLYGHGAAATTLAGSSYMYGGWMVVILMMGLAGVVFAVTYYLIMVPAYNSTQVGLFAMYAGVVIANFHLGEGDISGMWQGLIQRTVVFFLCLIFICFTFRGESTGSIRIGSKEK